MFLWKRTTPSTGDFSERTDKLSRELERADAVIIGAGAGLSASAGLTYSGERFEQNFADFIAKYHYRDMYSAAFQRYASPEEHWAYWSRHIHINRYAHLPGEVYENLLELVQNRDYFVITTNVDHCFQKTGFDKARLFYTQGDYGLWQCAHPCHDETYDNEPAVMRMVNEQKYMKIPPELVPCCPKCGGPMSMNLRSDHTFVEDAGWHSAAGRYTGFLENHENKHMLFLELGVGGNTPGIIKYPFWRMTLKNPGATYACVNLGEAGCPQEIDRRAICIDADIGEVLSALKQK